MKSEGNYRVVEKLWFFALLMFAGGFYGGYTFSLRGKVFANAQTANLVMMMLSFGNGEWKKGLYAFVPLTAYIVGVCMAEFISGKMNQKNKGLFEEKLLLFTGWYRRPAQPWSDDSYGKSMRCARGHYPEETRGRADCDCRKKQCRCSELYEGL